MLFVRRKYGLFRQAANRSNQIKDEHKVRPPTADDANSLFHLQRTTMQAYVVQTWVAWYDSINRFVESFYTTYPKAMRRSKHDQLVDGI